MLLKKFNYLNGAHCVTYSDPSINNDNSNNLKSYFQVDLYSQKSE